jgi:5-keto 4-deoxyuronate isomerase
MVRVLQAVEKSEKIRGVIGDIEGDRDTIEDKRDRSTGGRVAEQLERRACCWVSVGGNGTIKSATTHRASGERWRSHCAR